MGNGHVPHWVRRFIISETVHSTFHFQLDIPASRSSIGKFRQRRLRENYAKRRGVYLTPFDEFRGGVLNYAED